MTDLGQDIETLENAMRSFMQAIKRPQRWTRISATAGLAIDRPSAIILRVLILHEPRLMRIQDVAHELGIEPPSITRKTQLLEEMGYIKRQADPKDKRATCLKVTAKGHNASQKLWQAQRQDIAAILKKWPAAERHQLAKLFERFSHEFSQTL